MSVTVLRNFGPLGALPLTNRDLMRNVGLLARERIIRRTVGGEDARGYPFRRYSPAYEKRKRAAMGSRGVDLQVSGSMLRDIAIVEVTDTTVVLGFSK
jgi:hypothetical protein